MTDLVERLRVVASDIRDINGVVMKQWDLLRGQIEVMKGSDIPRVNFEAMMEDFAGLFVESADEIVRLRSEIEKYRQLWGPAAQAVRELQGP
jgi:hypothetical protein